MATSSRHGECYLSLSSWSEGNLAKKDLEMGVGEWGRVVCMAGIERL